MNTPQVKAQVATMTVNLPNGESLTLRLRALLTNLYSLMTYPLRIGVGYLLLGWRGAALAGVMALFTPRRS